MRLADSVVKQVILRLVKGQDYRIEILSLINADFLQFAIDFFKQVAIAKLENQEITIDWYKKEFLGEHLPKQDIIINSGLNVKTVSNMFNTARKEIAINAAWEHYDTLYQAISDLISQNDEIDITLTIKVNNVAVDLNINESLIVINTLAVKRAQIRGGAWSTAGKQVEKMLMKVLCNLFNVPSEHFDQSVLPESMREVDFYLLGHQPTERYRCEVKLMGKGNPESADAVIARDSRVFVADKLSDLNKRQLDQLGIEWVELRSDNGYKRFATVLNNLGIPYHEFDGDLDERIQQIFEEELYPE